MLTVREPSSSVNLKQGIVTVLHFDWERSSRSASSIRRTLSSDNMSSKNWLHQNGFFTAAEKMSSSDQECEKINPLRDDIWSSILTQKSELINSSDVIPPRPYVHPLVKRSASNLSEKSLEFCTENLGSENGSDGFSDSEILSEDEEDRERAVGDLNVAKYRKSAAAAVKVAARPFPPPLASVGGGGGGAPLLHMHSRRENGRLVLEAVSVPPKKYFHAQRGDGRLVLTLTSNPASEEVAEEEEEVEDGGGDGGSQAEEVAEVKYPMEKNVRSLMGVDKYYFGLVMKKLIAMENHVNLSWDNKFKKDEAIVVAPPPEMVVSPAAAASLNPYEYFWRSKTIVSGGCIHPMITTP